MSKAELILKATPPRLPRWAMERARLRQAWGDVHERTAIAVVAPPGFGKSTLLVQWQQLWLASGAFVAWLSVDAQDEPARFVMALLHALRRVAPGADLDALAMQSTAQAQQGMDALTGLLAGIAGFGAETVIILDNADQLPVASQRGPLAYLLYNAPPNLHLVVGSRVALALLPWEAATKGDFAVLGAEQLRFRPEESVAVLEQRFGGKLGLDDCMRLHESTEGWPIGLQLAASTIEGRSDLASAIASLSARRGGLERYFVESLFLRLPPDLADFLARVAILDQLDADVCAAVTGCALSGAYLDRLAHETPILMVGERDWIRLHPLARDFLLGRFEQFPPGERAGLHRRASDWFAGRESFHQAASHALAAGDVAHAQRHALRSLWTLGTAGQILEARMWLERIPADLVVPDPEARLVVAWINALGERHAEALAVARDILQDPATTPRANALALRVAAAAAAYSDQLGLLPGLLGRWPAPADGLAEPLYQVANLNALAMAALHTGNTAGAREFVARAAAHGNTGSLRLAAEFGTALVGLSHLWDGDACLAEAGLRPALAQAERQGGRRGMIACLHAPILAAALLERDQPGAARTLLANRLDVIERTGSPDTILLAYRTLARVAVIEGDERRGLNVLRNLGVLAMRRELPRLGIASLAEQIRLHALGGGIDAVDRLVEELDAFAGAFRRDALRLLEPQYQLSVAIAKAHTALARQHLADAQRELDAAALLARRLRRGRDAMTVKVLQAVLAHLRGGADATTLLAEAVRLADLGGNARLLSDTHPLAVRLWGQQASSPSLLRATHASTHVEPGAPADASGRSDDPRGQLLTPKETQVLNLLSAGRPNKLIARTLAISDETVKWHMKNLFFKLSAGSRSHAVDRARLLGLLDA